MSLASKFICPTEEDHWRSESWRMGTCWPTFSATWVTWKTYHLVTLKLRFLIPVEAHEYILLRDAFIPKQVAPHAGMQGGLNEITQAWLQWMWSRHSQDGIPVHSPALHKKSSQGQTKDHYRKRPACPMSQNTLSFGPSRWRPNKGQVHIREKEPTDRRVEWGRWVETPLKTPSRKSLLNCKASSVPEHEGLLANPQIKVAAVGGDCDLLIPPKAKLTDWTSQNPRGLAWTVSCLEVLSHYSIMLPVLRHMLEFQFTSGWGQGSLSEFSRVHFSDILQSLSSPPPIL